MKARTAILIALIFAFGATSIAQSLNVESPSSDTLQIPFIERFTEGSLEINNWVADCENWSIESDSGNPAPSVRFNGQPGIAGEYNCTLTSDRISTENAGSSVYIGFELKGAFNNYTGNDSLFIEVFDSVSWHTVWGFRPSTAPYWRDLRFNLRPIIDSLAYFKVRFRVNGNNSLDIDYWAIDNIFIYDGFKFPKYLEGNYYWDEEFGVRLNWNYRHMVGGWGAPVSWSWEANCGTLRLTNSVNWAYAAKWDSIGLGYGGSYLLIISAYIGDLNLNQLFLKVWTGENGDVVQYSRNIKHEAIANQWNYFYIKDPAVLYTDTTPFWVGFEVRGQHDGNYYPAGYGCNEAVDGWGNLFKHDLSGDWDTLPANYSNWNIMLQFFSDSTRYLQEGYKVSRKTGNDSNYKYYAFVEDYNNDVEYIDKYPNVDIQESYSYQVQSAWINHWLTPEDTIFSLPAFAKINDTEDFVTILVTHFPENNKKDFSLTAFPNPTTTILNIKSESKLKKIHIYNLLGQKVGAFGANNKKQMEIDVSSFKKGVYLLKIETGDGVVSRKFVVE